MSANPDRVTGWWVFAGILLFVSGALNIIYGIAAISDSKFFTENATLIATNLNTYGWVTLILGIIEFTAAFSLFAGGGWGRFVGIVSAGIASIVYLLAIPAAPFFSLALFALSLIILYGLAKSPEAA